MADGAMPGEMGIAQGDRIRFRQEISSSVAASACPLSLMPMREPDLAEVFTIEQQAYEFPWTQGNFVDSLKAGHSGWVVRTANGLVAYAVFMMCLDEAHLLNITVRPTQQRQGLGHNFLLRLLDIASDHGAVRFLLEVRAGNLPALALYRSCQFSEIGRRRNYYPAHNGREDALVMARDL